MFAISVHSDNFFCCIQQERYYFKLDIRCQVVFNQRDMHHVYAKHAFILHRKKIYADAILKKTFVDCLIPLFSFDCLIAFAIC